jgi:small subunit ribosomal protein S4
VRRLSSLQTSFCVFKANANPARGPMSKRQNSKYKIDRRMGENIWGRPKSPVNKRSYGPGQHGQRRAKKLSDYGTQLQAKQKLKGYYGNITERQFRKYYQDASRRPGDTGENMIGLLETRLDTVVYRSKFVPTPFAARQLVSHGHIRVNGRRVTIASYHVKDNDTIELSEGKSAKLLRTPKLADVPYAVQMEPHLIVEFYSR